MFRQPSRGCWPRSKRARGRHPALCRKAGWLEWRHRGAARGDRGGGQFRGRSNLKDDIRYAHDNIARFAKAQLDSCSETEIELRPGLKAGQRLIPISSAGAYVPADATAISPRR